MLLLFQCRKCGKFFCRSKHYTASVSDICCVKIINPCFIFYRNSKYACKDISYSHFNLVLLKVKFLSYFKFMQTVAQTHFSHSKADFCEMLPDTLLFREYLFADSYNFREQVHFWKKKTPAPVRKQTANQRSKCIQFSISLLQVLYKGHHLLRQYIIPGLLNCSSEIYLKIFLRFLLAPAVYITLYFIYQIPVSFLLQLHLLNILCQL